MSNPAVVKYQEKKIGNQNFLIDDNFGESIHIHFGDIRLDFSHATYHAFVSEVCSALNEIEEEDAVKPRNRFRTRTILASSAKFAAKLKRVLAKGIQHIGRITYSCIHNKEMQVLQRLFMEK